MNNIRNLIKQSHIVVVPTPIIQNIVSSLKDYLFLKKVQNY